MRLFATASVRNKMPTNPAHPVLVALRSSRDGCSTCSELKANGMALPCREGMDSRLGALSACLRGNDGEERGHQLEAVEFDGGVAEDLPSVFLGEGREHFC